MKAVVFALIGLLVGAFAGWGIAGIADMLIEPALLLIEITAALGALLGLLGARARRSRRPSSVT